MNRCKAGLCKVWYEAIYGVYTYPYWAKKVHLLKLYNPEKLVFDHEYYVSHVYAVVYEMETDLSNKDNYSNCFQYLWKNWISAIYDRVHRILATLDL